MSCPTCDHTMESLGVCDEAVVYLCPRCGTVKHGSDFDGKPLVYVPKLVERCRALEPTVLDSTIEFAWKHSGVSESINLPENRKP